MEKSTHRRLTSIIEYFGRHGIKGLLTHAIIIFAVALVLTGGQIQDDLGIQVMIFGQITFIAGIIHDRLVSIYSEVNSKKDLDRIIGEQNAFLFRYFIGANIVYAWFMFLRGVLIA